MKIISVVDGWLHAASVAVGSWMLRKWYGSTVVFFLTSLLISIAISGLLSLMEAVTGRS